MPRKVEPSTSSRIPSSISVLLCKGCECDEEEDKKKIVSKIRSTQIFIWLYVVLLLSDRTSIKLTTQGLDYALTTRFSLLGNIQNFCTTSSSGRDLRGQGLLDSEARSISQSKYLQLLVRVTSRKVPRYRILSNVFIIDRLR